MGIFEDIGNALKGGFELFTNPVGKVAQMTGDLLGGNIGQDFRNFGSQYGSLASTLTGSGLLGNLLQGGLGSTGKAISSYMPSDFNSYLSSGSLGDISNMASSPDWLKTGGEALKTGYDFANSPVGQMVTKKLLAEPQGQESQSKLAGLLTPSQTTSRTYSAYNAPGWTPLQPMGQKGAFYAGL